MIWRNRWRNLPPLHHDYTVGAGRKRFRDEDAVESNTLITISLSKDAPASGFALTSRGLDAPVGYIPPTGFLPRGRVRNEFLAAVASVPLNWLNLLNLPEYVILSRSLSTVPEEKVQASWDNSINRWFPNVSNGQMRFLFLLLWREVAKLTTCDRSLWRATGGRLVSQLSPS